MAPISTQVSSSSGTKLPPTGPKAYREGNAGPVAPGQAGAFAAHRNNGLPATQIPVGPSNGLFNRNMSSGSWQQRGSFRGRSGGMGMNGHGPRGGLDLGLGVIPPAGPSSQYGESSRQGLTGSLVRPPSPTTSRPPSPPMPPPPSSPKSTTAKQNASPVKRQKSRSPEKARSVDDDNMKGFRSTLIAERHAPISISLPTMPIANGRGRPLPPHMTTGISTSRTPPPPKDEPPGPPSSPPPPPPPPADPSPAPSPPRSGFSNSRRHGSPSPSARSSRRPASPSDPLPSSPRACQRASRQPSPPSSRARPPTPPPPPSSPPAPPPADEPPPTAGSSLHSRHISITLPSTPVQPSSRQPFALPSKPLASSQISTPSASTSQAKPSSLPPFAPSMKPNAPPAFHFRELPTRQTPSEEESDGDDDEEMAKVNEDAPPPPSPKSSYVPPPYVPPPSTTRRPGLGNYLIISDIANAKKALVKRYDGITDGEPINATDPRLRTEDWKRGRGGAKVRPTLYEVEYEWDASSTGPKPPPPPEAVLITGLNPLTTVDQIRKFLQPHGRARDINSKMDSRSGMQLGICWVKFDGPTSGRKGTAHDVAVHVTKVCDGQRIGLSGTEKIKVVLDGRGLRTEKAVKEEMARRYPPKPVAPPKPAVPAAPAAAATPKAPTPSSGTGTPRADMVRATPASSSSTPVRPPIIVRPLHASLPTRPRMGLQHPNQPFPARPIPSRPAAHRLPFPSSLPSRPPATQDFSSSFTDSPFDQRRGRSSYAGDSYAPGSRSRSRSRSRGRSHPRSCSTCSSRASDSEDDRHYRSRRSPSPVYRGRDRRGKLAPKRDTLEDEAAIQRVRKALENNGKSHVFIDSTALPAKSVNDADLWNHFRTYKPIQVLSNFQGWYILFDNDGSAARAKMLDNTSVRGHRIVINIRSAVIKKPDGPASPVTEKSKPLRSLAIPKKYIPPPPKGKSPSPVKHRRAPSYSSSDSDSDVERPQLRRKIAKSVTSGSDASEDERTVLPDLSTKSPESDQASTLVQPIDTPEPVKQIDEEPVKAGKKRPAKAKVAKKSKKARLDSPVLDVPLPVEPAVAEIKLDQSLTKETKVAKPRPAKAAKPRKPAKTELEKFLASGVVVDEEDAYWLGQVLASVHEGAEVDLSDGEESDDEDKAKEGHPLYHQAGSWRANGWKKVPQIAKAEYLPERNRAQVSKEEVTALTSGRTARVTGRRLAHDMETTRKTATAANTAESDMFAFNQLRIRKKQLRFSRSPIEGYGLYAMETIHPGEMVCEYVGEICRSAVAEVREQRYLKQGIGSSYLFRIDADMVCDATFKGSVSRLINHSCDPSASAKIISINGQSKIVIYAKRTLHPGQEILYDYKFPLESDPSLRVPCLCGAATCRGWLN